MGASISKEKISSNEHISDHTAQAFFSIFSHNFTRKRKIVERLSVQIQKFFTSCLHLGEKCLDAHSLNLIKIYKTLELLYGEEVQKMSRHHYKYLKSHSRNETKTF